jgi:hypothetical protein
MRFNTCYGNIGWLDALHGTDGMYKKHKAQLWATFELEQKAWEGEVGKVHAAEVDQKTR